MHQLCLNMIVKNEALNLSKLIASLHEVIDYYVISDTGSTDNTIEVIKEEMGKYGVPGEVFEDKWENFGHNRQLALDKAVGKTKYVLFIDGDETLGYKDKDFASKLTHGKYNMIKQEVGMSNILPSIINIENNNKYGWKWHGPLHEYMSNTNKKYSPTTDFLKDVVIHRSVLGVGGNSTGLTQKEKYTRDAKVFEKDLLKNPNNERSVFYLAQSYKDAFEPEKSIKNYRKRIAMGGWIEEVYYSHLMIADLLKQLKRPFEESLKEYLEAYQKVPTRMEAVFYIVDHYRLTDNLKLGHLFGKVGSRIVKPTSGLFLFESIYDYQMYDSYSVCAFWAGDYEDSAYFSQKILDEKKIPDGEIQRIKNNLKFSLDNLKIEPIKKKKKRKRNKINTIDTTLENP
jgi:glycosyltransferase involved in cell wall biosynthesis